MGMTPQYENIYLAFHLRIRADLSGLLGVVLLFERFRFSFNGHGFASVHPPHPLSKYLDSFLSIALDCLRGGIVSPPRVESRSCAGLCHHHHGRHGIVGRGSRRRLLITADGHEL